MFEHGTAGVCPVCRRIYPNLPTGPARHCTKDGNPLDRRSVLAGKFILESKLGQGGMGAVWKGYQPELARDVAIKFLLPRLSTDPGYVHRFQREARAAGQLDHPNIIRFYDTGQADGQCYLAMEYLPGETLLHLLKREGKLPLPLAFSIWRPIVNAMAAAHGKGVVHRDLKPENILLSQPAAGEPPELVVKVVDFGLAKLRGTEAGPLNDRATATGTTMGSPLYMAPEQFGGSKMATDLADVFALGVMLYEMVTGKRPYPKFSIGLVAGPPPPLLQAAPEVPPLLSDMVARMLAVEPTERPSVTEVKAVLARLRVGETAAVRRRRWLTEGALVLTPVLALALLFSLILRNREPAIVDPAAQQKQALRVLQAALASPSSSSLRQMAVIEVGGGLDPGLYTILAPALSDRAAEVRGSAAEGLGQLWAFPEVPALKQLADHDAEAQVQAKAANALTTCGSMPASTSRSHMGRKSRRSRNERRRTTRCCPRSSSSMLARPTGRSISRSWKRMSVRISACSRAGPRRVVRRGSLMAWQPRPRVGSGRSRRAGGGWPGRPWAHS